MPPMLVRRFAHHLECLRASHSALSSNEQHYNQTKAGMIIPFYVAEVISSEE
jgi:hypothetical protein